MKKGLGSICSGLKRWSAPPELVSLLADGLNLHCYIYALLGATMIHYGTSAYLLRRVMPETDGLIELQSLTAPHREPAHSLVAKIVKSQFILSDTSTGMLISPPHIYIYVYIANNRREFGIAGGDGLVEKMEQVCAS